MSARQRDIGLYLLQAVLYISIVIFALYEFKRHTSPQPIYFTNAENALKSGKESAARKEFDEALRQRPRDPEVYMSVIQSCITQHKSLLEIEYAERAIAECKSQRPQVLSAFYVVIADAASKTDQPPHQQQAIDAGKHAFDLTPDNPVVQNQYGYLLADNALGRGPDVDKALTILRKALDGSRNSGKVIGELQSEPMFVAETEDSYGWALYKNEQYADAITTLTQALADYPENAFGDDRKVSYYHLGMAYAKLGRKDQAANAFNSALAYDAKYSDALKALARLGTGF
jgi:tetratricopeptide (TPR) repeat protein